MTFLPAVLRGAAALALVASPLQAAPAAKAEEPAGPPKTILAVPFAAGGDAQDWAGVAVAETITDAVVQANRDNFITLKQLDAVLRRRNQRLSDTRVSAEGLELARSVGATEFCNGLVMVKGDTATIEGKLYNAADGAELKSAREVGPLASLPKLAFQLTETLLHTGSKAGPLTHSARALEMVSKCAVELDRQSVGPRSRITLTGQRLEEADTNCQSALEADNKLGLAHAYESILLAVHGRNEDARKEAELSQTFKRYVAMGTLADAFALRRAGNVDAARQVLADAVKAHPGFLHAIGYLAEEQEDLNQPQAALDWWLDYSARSPGHPFATARAGRALTRLGKPAEGLALTEKALERSPNDPELLVELASRYIDSNQNDQAEKILLQIEGIAPPRSLAWLRLGYLYMHENKLPAARDQFVAAAKHATAEDEGRVRAMADADLAQANGADNQYEAAVAALKAAAKEGMHKLPCDSAELVKYKGKPEFDQICASAATAPGGLNDDEDVVAIDVQ